MVYYGVWYAAAAVINFPRQNELAIEANITALLANRNRYNNNHLAWLHFVSFANDHNFIFIIAISTSIPGFGNNFVDGGSDDS